MKVWQRFRAFCYAAREMVGHLVMTEGTAVMVALVSAAAFLLILLIGIPTTHMEGRPLTAPNVVFAGTVYILIAVAAHTIFICAKTLKAHGRDAWQRGKTRYSDPV